MPRQRRGEQGSKSPRLTAPLSRVSSPALGGLLQEASTHCNTGLSILPLAARWNLIHGSAERISSVIRDLSFTSFIAPNSTIGLSDETRSSKTLNFMIEQRSVRLSSITGFSKFIPPAETSWLEIGRASCRERG